MKPVTCNDVPLQKVKTFLIKVLEISNTNEVGRQKFTRESNLYIRRKNYTVYVWEYKIIYQKETED